MFVIRKMWSAEDTQGDSSQKLNLFSGMHNVNQQATFHYLSTCFKRAWRIALKFICMYNKSINILKSSFGWVEKNINVFENYYRDIVTEHSNGNFLKF